MKCSREKAGVYAFTTLVIAFVLNSIGTFTVTRVSLASSALFGADSTAVQFDENSPLDNLEQWSKELEKQTPVNASDRTSRCAPHDSGAE